jgi:predicted TIM-barrel fold metal-dependent hydrolase
MEAPWPAVKNGRALDILHNILNKLMKVTLRWKAGALIEIIDSHAHIVTSDVNAFPPVDQADPKIAAVLQDSFDFGRLSGEMTSNGVVAALLVQRGQVYGYDNNYVLNAAARSGGRMKAVCGINARVDDCVTRARELVRRGAAGLRLMAQPAEVGFNWLDGETALPLWQCAAETGTPMCVHFFPPARAEGLRRLEKLVTRHPSLPVVIDHLANPAIRDVEACGLDKHLEPLTEHGNVALKFTTIPLANLSQRGIDAGAILRKYIDRFGADRLMWGSDITQSAGAYSTMVELVRDAVITLAPAERQWLLAGTCAAIYGFAATGLQTPDVHLTK